VSGVFIFFLAFVFPIRPSPVLIGSFCLFGLGLVFVSFLLGAASGAPSRLASARARVGGGGGGRKRSRRNVLIDACGRN